nr:serine/threonine-protein kinase/endoribonuclease IRE1b-like [Tanacetum cinerariifolium]
MVTKVQNVTPKKKKPWKSRNSKVDAHRIVVKHIMKVYHEVDSKEIQNLIGFDEHTNIVRWHGSSAKVDSLADACRDLDTYVDLPALLVAFSFGALADSGSFPSLHLLDPQSGLAEGSSSLSASSSRRLFSVTVSLYVSKMILSDSYA